jgi:hypothetical protein
MNGGDNMDDILKSIELLKQLFDPLDIPAVVLTIYLVQILKPIFKIKRWAVRGFALLVGFVLSPAVIIIYQYKQKIELPGLVLAAYFFIEGLKLGIGSIFLKSLWNGFRGMVIRGLGGVEKGDK